MSFSSKLDLQIEIISIRQAYTSSLKVPLKAYIKQENTCKLQCSCQPCLSLPNDYFLEKAATCIARLQTLPGYSIWHLSVTAFTLEIAVSKPGYSSHFHVSRVTNDQCLLLSLLCWVCFFFSPIAGVKIVGDSATTWWGCNQNVCLAKILSDTKKKECDKCFSSVGIHFHHIFTNQHG